MVRHNAVRNLVEDHGKDQDGQEDEQFHRRILSIPSVVVNEGEDEGAELSLCGVFEAGILFLDNRQF